MALTLLALCNASNSIYCNSEPLDWGSDAEYVYLKNRNDATEYRIAKHTEATQEGTLGFVFQIAESLQTLYLEFFKEVPLTDVSL